MKTQTTNDVHRSIIHGIVDRQHVSSAMQEVMVAVIACLRNPDDWTNGTIDAAMKKRWYRWAYARHQANRAMYSHVIGGRLGKRAAKHEEIVR